MGKGIKRGYRRIWGNNSISENLNYTHLINVSQIGLYNKDAAVPTDEEIWG